MKVAARDRLVFRVLSAVGQITRRIQGRFL